MGIWITHEIWTYSPNFIRNSVFRRVQSEILIHVQDSHTILLTESPPLASLVCGGGNSRKTGFVFGPLNFFLGKFDLNEGGGVCLPILGPLILDLISPPKFSGPFGQGLMGEDVQHTRYSFNTSDDGSNSNRKREDSPNDHEYFDDNPFWTSNKKRRK